MRWFWKSSDTTEHEYVEERLSAYLDGELSPKERTIVDQHLAACQSCQWNLATLKQTVQWTRELPAVPVPRVFTIPASAAPTRRPRRNWGFVPLLQGATALVALLLFFVAAGDFLLTGSMLPAAAPEPQMLGLDAPAESRAVVEMEAAAEVRVTAAVEAEKEAPPADTPAERVAADPTQPPAAPVVETVQVEKAVAATESAAGGEADATEEAKAPAAEIQATAVEASVTSVRATPTRPLTATYFFTFTTPGPRPTRFMSAARTVPTAKVMLSTDAPRFTPTSASMTIPTASAVVVPPNAAPPTLTPTPTAFLPLAPTATALPVTTVLPAATLLPTALPQTASPTAMPRPTVLPHTAPPTVVVQAQEPERQKAIEGGSEPAALRQAPAVPWLRLVELGLATAFVLLAAVTLVAMVRRRQAG